VAPLLRNPHRRLSVNNKIGLSTDDVGCQQLRFKIDLLPWYLSTSAPLSSKELVLEFQYGYSCMVGTFSVEILFLLKYTIFISSFSKNFSSFFVSYCLVLIRFLHKIYSFSIRGNPVEPSTMLLYINSAWGKV